MALWSLMKKLIILIPELLCPLLFLIAIVFFKNYLVNTLKHANSSMSHSETKASALPVAKYLPVGSNSMHIQVPGCAFKIC